MMIYQKDKEKYTFYVVVMWINNSYTCSGYEPNNGLTVE